MMKAFAAAVALAAGTNALALKRDAECDCSFTLTTSGDVSFTVGEDSEGEVLGGSSLTAASFCLNGDTIVDSNGLPCWFTPPTNVLQCDQGATASSGITIGCDGVVAYNGSTTFYECPNGIDDEVNIYSSPDEGTNCGSITLTADSCKATCTTSSSAAPSTTCPAPSTATETDTVTVTQSASQETQTETVTITQAVTQQAQTVTVTATQAETQTVTASACASSSTCPMDLSGSYEYPHLIVPVDSSSPDTAAGTSYFGEVSSTISTIFNFDIPDSDANKQCTLWFLFPSQDQLTTSSYNFTGSGTIDFSSLSDVATESTTYNNAPSVASDLGQFTVSPGNAYQIANFTCPSGTTVSYEISASDDTSLRYFQDYNPCPIGMYIVPGN